MGHTFCTFLDQTLVITISLQSGSSIMNISRDKFICHNRECIYNKPAIPNLFNRGPPIVIPDIMWT